MTQEEVKEYLAKISTPLYAFDDMREKMASIFSAALHKKPIDITLGLEIEAYIVSKAGHLMGNMTQLEEILEELPHNIWHDYYPYQLEIRSDPHRSVEKIMKEVRELFELAAGKLYSEGYIVLPVGSFSGAVPCGTHIHVRYPGKQYPYSRSWAAYPFVLLFARAFRNSPAMNTASRRWEKTQHLGIPPINHLQFMAGEKNRDLFWNKARHVKGTSRQRVKEVNTLETRIYDSLDFAELETLLRLHKLIFSRIKDTPFRGYEDIPQFYVDAIIQEREWIAEGSFKSSNLQLLGAKERDLIFGLDGEVNARDWSRSGNGHWNFSNWYKDLQANKNRYGSVCLAKYRLKYMKCECRVCMIERLFSQMEEMPRSEKRKVLGLKEKLAKAPKDDEKEFWKKMADAAHAAQDTAITFNTTDIYTATRRDDEPPQFDEENDELDDDWDDED